jgi:DNA-binding transcriptional ArsR family regulator
VAAKISSKVKELNEQLALLVSCMNTIEVLTVLAERAASPKEIGELLGLKTPTVSHHIKKLLNLRMIELIEERDVGGTILHVYRAIVRPLVSTKEWDKLSVTERERYSIWIVQLILIDASKSFASHLFDAHSDNHLSRTPVVADELGLTEVAEIQNKALDEIFHAQAIMADRMAREGTTGMNIIAAMMCFQLPEPSRPATIGDE